jgi:hypothetical protein
MKISKHTSDACLFRRTAVICRTASCAPQAAASSSFRYSINIKYSTMNKCISRLVFVTGLIAFLSSTVTGQTQSTSSIGNNLYMMEKGQYVLPPVAIARLDNAMQSLKTQMSGLDPGSQLNQQLNGRYVYYHMMRRMLFEEKATTSAHVQESITRSLGVYATDTYEYVSQNQKLQNKQEAITLLKL